MANNTRSYDNRNIVSKYIHYKLLKRGYVWDSHVGRESGSPNNNGLLGSSPSSSPVLVRRPVPDPGEGPSLLVNRTPRVDPHADLHKVLREAGDEISRRYQREFAEMAGQLHFTPTTVQRKFESVVEELFRDGVNWGRIVAFFEFGGTMCLESVNREMTSQVDNIANWMTEYLNGPLQNWIQENGGWDAFVELYGSQRGSMFYSWPSLKTALSLAALGAAGITIGAYFVQK